MIKLIIPGRPVPKSRPRVVRGHAYTPQKTQRAEETIAWHARAQWVSPLRGAVKMSCVFYFKGKGHGDIDNLIKLCADSLNGICYKDDRQILDLHGVILLKQKEEKTEILITEF